MSSPGSTLKPFIYGMVLDKGLIHSKSLLSDIPADFNGYKPQNLNGQFKGAITVEKALQYSLNIPAIQLLNRLSPATFDQHLQSVGVKLQHQKANLSIGLGGTGTSLVTLAMLYRALADNGKIKSLNWLKHNKERDNLGHVLSPQSSWIIFDILSKQSAPDRVIPSTRLNIAWKTGTSYGYRDFWSIGVSPDHTVAIWVGRPYSTPMVGYLGATQAAPIMFDIFDLLPNTGNKLIKPKEIKEHLTCWPSGRMYLKREKSHCAQQHLAYTVKGLTPPTLELQGDFINHNNWPIELAHWLKLENQYSEDSSSSIAITSPSNGQHFFRSQIDEIDLEASYQHSEIKWFVNHLPVAGSRINLQDYLGETTLSVCIMSVCDKKTIYIHN